MGDVFQAMGGSFKPVAGRARPKNGLPVQRRRAFVRRMGKITQKEFVEAVREAGIKDSYSPSVDYCHPGVFRVGDKQIKIEMRRLALFLVKLSAAMKFEYYDRLTRTVYIQHMQAERKAYAIAEDRPQDATKQNRLGTYNPS